jgi:hypothetical protein
LAGLASAAPALPDEINVPPGYEVVRLTNDGWLDLFPRINNLGHVVWSKRIVNSYGEEIFLYDGVRIRQITDNDLAEWHPDINDDGLMVWQRRTKPELYADGEEILVYDGKTERIITDNEYLDSGPRINNLGHVVWSQFTGGACHPSRKLLWDGTRTTVIVDDGYNNGSAEINDFDQFAWTRYDDCAGPSTWKGMIRYYTGREIINITDGAREDQVATLNNRGLVGYGIGYPEEGIGWWQNSRTGVLTDLGYAGWLNNRDHWVFTRWYEEDSISQVWIWRDGPIRMTKSGVTENSGQINDCGEIVWLRYREDRRTDVFLMRLVPGDANHDGKTSATDFMAGFAVGVSGPRQGIPFCEGPSADMDHDGDVDLADFAMMQAADVLAEHFERLVGCISGPQLPRDLCASLAIDFDRDGDVDLKDFVGFQAVMGK